MVWVIFGIYTTLRVDPFEEGFLYQEREASTFCWTAAVPLRSEAKTLRSGRPLFEVYHSTLSLFCLHFMFFFLCLCNNISMYLTPPSRNQPYEICDQRRPRAECADA